MVTAPPPRPDSRTGSPADPRADRQLARIARGGALNLAGGVVAGLSGFALTAVVTNEWPAADAGALFSATSLFLILSATTLLGVDTGLARFVLRYEAQGQAADTDTLLRVALRPVVVVSVVAGALLATAADTVASWTGLPPGGATALRLLAVALPLATVTDAFLSATRAFGSMRATVLLDRLLRSGGQPVLVAVAAVPGMGLAGLVVAWSLPYAAAALLAPPVLLRLARARRSAAPADPPRPVAVVRREFWRYTWLRGVARVFQVGLQRADIIMVAALRSPAEAALYTAATRFVVLGQLGVQAVQQVLQPRLSQLLASDERGTLRNVFSTSTAWIIASSWPVYLTAIVAAPLYLRVFGERYVAQGQLVVVVMGLGMLLAVASGPVDVLLLMSGRSVQSLANNAAGLVVDVALNLVLIPRYGIGGAAVSWAVALAVRNLLPFWQVHRDQRVTGLGRATALVVVASSACFGAPMLALRCTAGLDVVPALALMTAETAAYLLVLWRLRGPLQLAAMRRGGRRRSPEQREQGQSVSSE